MKKDESTTTTTEAVLIVTDDDLSLPPAITAESLFDDDGFNAVLKAAEAYALSISADVSTKQGRDFLKSQAYKFSRLKTKLDDLGKAKVESIKKVTKKVDAKRKIIRDTIDELRDLVRKPLTEWEEAEKARVSQIKTMIQRYEEIVRRIISKPITERTLEEIAEADDTITNTFRPDSSYQEFEADARDVKARLLSKIHQLFEEQREWDRLKKLEADIRNPKPRGIVDGDSGNPGWSAGELDEESAQFRDHLASKMKEAIPENQLTYESAATWMVLNMEEFFSWN